MHERKRVGDFQLVDHGIDGSQYFQGCGTAFTQYEFCATGNGDTPAEALDDLLEMVAQQDFETEDLEKRILEDAGVDKIHDTPSAMENALEANGMKAEARWRVLDEDGEVVETFETEEEAVAYRDGRNAQVKEEYEWTIDEDEEYAKEREKCHEECDCYYYLSLRWNAETDPWYCQNCGEKGDEDDFTPTDGNPAPHICPKCGSTNCFPEDKDDAERSKETHQD